MCEGAALVVRMVAKLASPTMSVDDSQRFYQLSDSSSIFAHCNVTDWRVRPGDLLRAESDLWWWLLHDVETACVLLTLAHDGFQELPNTEVFFVGCI